MCTLLFLPLLPVFSFSFLHFFYTPSSSALFRVPSFFSRFTGSASLGGLYGHETRSGKRHVSEPSNENVADATRFRRRSMLVDVYCYYSRYTHMERITLEGRNRLRSTSFQESLANVFHGTSSRRGNKK